MLAGRYPSDEFAELGPARLGPVVRHAHRPPGRATAGRHLGRHHPDRGLYGVFLAAGDGPGRRVGELDEEMVYESRVGDVFTLGTCTWRIEDITHDQVLVTPAPGLPVGCRSGRATRSAGRPSWAGRSGRSSARSRRSTPGRTRAGQAAGLDEWAADNLLDYLRSSARRPAPCRRPDHRRRAVPRRARRLAGRRPVPVRRPVHAPWALCVRARMRERFGVDVQAMHGDDGIVFRLPDLEFDDIDGGAERGVGRELLDLVTLDPDDVHGLVTEEIGGSALFAARFRECAARALLLPRRRPDRRSRCGSSASAPAQLLEVASQYPTFPIVLEAVRECVQDVFDVPGLVDLMRGSARARSPSSTSRAPARRRSRSRCSSATSRSSSTRATPAGRASGRGARPRPRLLADLLGPSEGLALRDLLDPHAIARPSPSCNDSPPSGPPRRRGPARPAAHARPAAGRRHPRAVPRERPGDDVPAWLATLVGASRSSR